MNWCLYSEASAQVPDSVQAAGVVTPGPDVYETFDYPVGVLNGRSGNSEIGLSGVWQGYDGSNLACNSLKFGTLTTKGNRFEASGVVNHCGGTRKILTAALAGKGLLKDGATLWFSMEVGYTAKANTTNARLAVAFANNGFNRGNYEYFIDDLGAQLGSGVGITLGCFDRHHGRVVATQFQDLSQGKGIAGNIYGSWEGNGAVYGAGQSGFIVGCFHWAADPLEPDVIELFQPKPDLKLPESPISILKAPLDQATFDTLTFARSDCVVLDEIRFGPTYGSVL